MMDFEKNNDAGSLLQFQDFGTGNTSKPAASGQPPPYEQTHNFSNFPSSHIDIDEEKEPLDPSAANTEQNVPSMLSWAYYQRFFDVDTPQVKERLIWSFLPRPSRDTLTTYIRPTPDLYGPFWVCVTLVFCIAIMGNVADYMHSGGEGQHWRYDFRKVSISASTIFCYALLVPSVLWGFLWWKKKQDEKPVLGLMELVSLYGYSLVIYIPISILWAVPFAWFQWTMVIVGATLSGSVLVLSLWPPLSSIQKGVAAVIIAVLLTLHFLLAVGLQLYFFSYTSQVAVVPGTGNGASSSGDIQAIEPHQHPMGAGVTKLKDLNLVLEQEPHGHKGLDASAMNPVLPTTLSNTTITEKTIPQSTVEPKLSPTTAQTTKALPVETTKPSANITTRVGEANKVKDSVKTR